MTQRQHSIQIAHKCTQCNVAFLHASYCTTCKVLYCDECRYINLTPLSVHADFKNTILCKRCFIQTFQSADHVKQSGIWPCVDMMNWVHTILTTDDLKAAAIVYKHNQDMLSIQQCMSDLVVTNPSQSSNLEPIREFVSQKTADVCYDYDAYDAYEEYEEYDIYDRQDLDSP
jgi:hypothetical protein